MRQFTAHDLRSIFENEGVGCALGGYMGPDNIVDPELRRLFTTAQDAVKALTAYVQDKTHRH